MIRDSTQWRPLLLKGGGLIQMEIGGHPPIPLAQNNCPFWQFPSYLFYGFLGPKLSRSFWHPKQRFLAIRRLNGCFWHAFDPIGGRKAWIELCNELSNAQIGDRMQKLWPQEVDCSTYHLGFSQGKLLCTLWLCFFQWSSLCCYYENVLNANQVRT